MSTTTTAALLSLTGLSLFLALRARRKTPASSSPAVDHIVFFRLGRSAAAGAAPCSPAARMSARLDLLLRRLSSLPCVLDVSLGRRFNDAPRAHGYTHGIVVRLVNAEALPVYANHPQHLAVVELLRAELDSPAAASASASDDALLLPPPVLALDIASPRILGTAGGESKTASSSSSPSSNNTRRSVSHVVPLCLRPSCHPGCASCRLG